MDNIPSRIEFLDGRVRAYMGDITREDADAIVNAANATLLGGAGVDGAIHRAGGPQILEECWEIRRTRFPGGLPTGEAVITTGGNLLSQFVIHTVGPVYGGEFGREDELLRACYINSLRIAAEMGISSIAFPAISTGAFQFPKNRAAPIASCAITDFLAREDSISDIRLVFFKQDDLDIFMKCSDF